ncbi:hypothetical protein [Amycolatopsis echigonensis]|uniref:Uncharacterized protein n=2 Tax=Amycolatopsis echigonensis TaxID=2576905 RepID=A0A2N3WSJ1_9PSEU|nr:hypothetical protein [Amycolatopsis echigonensis]PKV96839.1 hypothetical protein ATK30_7802 [Amycolatopsis niigatensis]
MMPDLDPAEPETLDQSESLDEDELRVDPLEAGVEPPERWSPVAQQAPTPAEAREGEPLGRRLAEERPDVQPVPNPPDDETLARAEAARAAAPDEDLPQRRADPDPGEQADEAGGSVAKSLREE